MEFHHTLISLSLQVCVCERACVSAWCEPVSGPSK